MKQSDIYGAQRESSDIELKDGMVRLGENDATDIALLITDLQATQERLTIHLRNKR